MSRIQVGAWSAQSDIALCCYSKAGKTYKMSRASVTPGHIVHELRKAMSLERDGSSAAACETVQKTSQLHQGVGFEMD